MAASSSFSPSSSSPLSFLHSHSHCPTSPPTTRRHVLLPPLGAFHRSLSSALRPSNTPKPSFKLPSFPTVPTTAQQQKHGEVGEDVAATEAFPTPETCNRSAWASGPGLLLSFLPPTALVGSLLGGFNIEGPQSTLEAIGVLAAIITVHESGHFLAAYLQGIHVTQFAIGFGPTLLKWQGKRVEYSLRAVPLGGFVGFPDEDPESGYAADDPNLLKNRPILDRVLVISAGVIANFIFAYSILFGQVVTVGLLQQEILPGVVIPEVVSTSVAAQAGFEPRDLIVGIAGKALAPSTNYVQEVVEAIKESPERSLSFLVSRAGKMVEIQVVPVRNPQGVGKIGVQLAPNVKASRAKAQNLVEAVTGANREFGRLCSLVADGLKQIAFNFSQTADKISGPVAIVAVGAEVARADVTGLFQFAAIVNINLAIVNILPLPALDGGYLLLILLEAVRGGKKIPTKVEQGIMSSGTLLLLMLGMFLMVRDAINLALVPML